MAILSLTSLSLSLSSYLSIILCLYHSPPLSHSIPPPPPPPHSPTSLSHTLPRYHSLCLSFTPSTSLYFSLALSLSLSFVHTLSLYISILSLSPSLTHLLTPSETHATLKTVPRSASLLSASNSFVSLVKISIREDFFFQINLSNALKSLWGYQRRNLQCLIPPS